MAKLTLGKGIIQTSPAREAYTALRLKYQDLAEKAQQDFSDRFSILFSNMDQLHLNCTKVAQQYLDDPIDQGIRDLIAIGIMDIDDEQFRKRLLVPYSSWGADFAEIDDQYLAIILKAEELAKYKAARRESGGVGIVGGGFGLEGAVGGMAVATAANVAIGMVGGVFNLGADALSAMGDGMQKRSLYNDPKTKNHLAESIYRLVFQVHLAIVDAAVENNKAKYEKVSEDDTLKAKSLFVNVSKGRITGDKAESCLIESITLNPFEPTSYLLWFNLYSDIDGHLSNVAKHFGIREVSDCKRQMLLQYKATLKVSTVEECESSLIDLEYYANTIGCQNIEGERANILNLIDRLKLEQRTFNGVVYETQEAAQVQKDIAQAQKEELRKNVDGVYYSTKEEADEVRAKKKSVSFFHGLSIFIAPLPNALLILQPGYSKKARLLANIWLILILILIIKTLPNLSDKAILPIYIIFLTLFGLFVIPVRIAIDSLFRKVYENIKGPLTDSEVALSTNNKIDSKDVKIWFIAVSILFLIFILIVTILGYDKGTNETPVAIKSTEIVEPTLEVEELKAATPELDEIERALEEAQRAVEGAEVEN